MSVPKSTLLMTPGPSEVHPEVLAALARPQLVHYGQEWGKFYDETCCSLRDFFGVAEKPMLLFGPGSLVMEMAISNALKPGDDVVNVVTGYFGKRWEQVLTSRRLHPFNLTTSLGRSVPPAAVEKAFKDRKNAKALVAVHADTSSGVLSPIEEYAEIARKYGAVVIVDAICSFAGVPIMMDKWDLDFCVGYPSKCLSSISGVTPFACSRRYWEVVDSEEHDAGWYVNLRVIRKFIQEWGSWGHPYPTTIPVQAVVALREAARILHEEGLENCFSRHRKVALAVRDAARAMGLQLVAEDDVAAPTVTPMTIGDGLEKRVQSMLLERHNIQVGGGLLAPMIRIGHMGRSATSPYVLATISALEAVLRKLGRPVKQGTGLTAAQKHIDDV